MYFSRLSPASKAFCWCQSPCTLCWASWLVIFVGCETKVCTFHMNTAMVMPFRIFNWTKQRTKVNPAAIIISIFYKLIPVLKHLQDDWQFQGWKIHGLRTFNCKLIFQFSSEVTAPENLFFGLFFFFLFFFQKSDPYAVTGLQELGLKWKKFQFENFNCQHYESYFLLSIDINISSTY